MAFGISHDWGDKPYLYTYSWVDQTGKLVRGSSRGQPSQQIISAAALVNTKENMLAALRGAGLEGKYTLPDQLYAETREGVPAEPAETFIGSAAEIAAAEKYRKARRGEVMPEIVYDPKKHEELEKTWGKEVVAQAALDYYRKLKPIQEEKEAQLKFQVEYKAAEKSLNDAREAARKAREDAGLPPAEIIALDPLIATMDAERKRILEAAEEDVAVAKRAKEIEEVGFDDVDEYGNIFHRVPTKSEAIKIAQAERLATKEVVAEQASLASLAGTGLEVSGIALDLLALVSPTLATRLRKVVKVTKGVARVEKLVTKAAKVPKSKIKKALKPSKRIVKAALKVPKIKIPKPSKESIAEAAAAASAGFKKGGIAKETGSYIIHKGEEIRPHTPITTQRQYRFFRAELAKPAAKRLTDISTQLLKDHIAEWEASAATRSQSARGSGNPDRRGNKMKKGSKEAKAWGAKMRRARNAGKTKRKTSTRTVSTKRTKRRASTGSRTEYID